MASDPTDRRDGALSSEEQQEMLNYYNLERDGQQDGIYPQNIDSTEKGNPKAVLANDATGNRWGAVKNRVRQRAQQSCTKKLLHKRLPILSWAPKYNSADAVGDLVAGITVGLTVIPQSLPYATLAGLDPQYGLYGAFFGCLLYIIFGSHKDVPIGPTAVMSLLTFQQVGHHGIYAPYYAILLNFLTGCIELAMGILALGFVIDFISGPVSSGFTSAAALIIATSQVKDILGITASGSTFVESWNSLFRNMHNTRPGDTILGVACIIILLLMRLLTTTKIGPKDGTPLTPRQTLINKSLWLIGTARNAIVVVISMFIGYVSANSYAFKLTGDVPPGLPAFQAPPFQFYNEYENRTVTFGEMTSELGAGLIVVPLVALMEDIAICKAFSGGKSVDATQELIAIGICNIGNSFVQAYPVSGALSRGAVQNASGGRTTLAGLYTGVLVIFALLFLTQFFYFIPKAALAAVIIAAVIFMVEYHVVKPIWKTKKMDLIPAFATFFSCLFIRLELGILIGIGVNVLFLLYASARPRVRVERTMSPSGCEYLLITPDRSLVFPSVEYVRNLVSKAGLKQGSSSIPVVIDSTYIQGADFTAAKGIKSLTEDFVKRNQPIYFYNLKPSIMEIFQGVKPKDFIYCRDETELNELLKEKQCNANDA